MPDGESPKLEARNPKQIQNLKRQTKRHRVCKHPKPQTLAHRLDLATLVRDPSGQRLPRRDLLAEPAVWFSSFGI
jgi:hypothetical protein